MGYSKNDSLERIAEYLPERFSVKGGEDLFVRLKVLEEDAMGICGREMEEGLHPTIERFSRIYTATGREALNPPGMWRGIDFKRLEQRDPVEIWQLLREHNDELISLSTEFERQIKELLEDVKGFELKPGPIKEESKIVNEVFLRWPEATDRGNEIDPFDERIRFIRDIIRGRIEAMDLKGIAQILAILTNEGSLRDRMISCFNTYDRLFTTRRDKRIPRPYVGCNLAFAITDNMPYELQIMTKRAALVGKITHGGLLVDNPIPLAVQEDAETLAWASHILDYEDL